MLVRCPGCKGSKKVMKLGMGEGDCNLCKGIGSIKEEPKIEEKTEPKIEKAKDSVKHDKEKKSG